MTPHPPRAFPVPVPGSWPGALWHKLRRWWRYLMAPVDVPMMEDLASDPALAALVRDNERVDAAIRMWCGEDGR